MSVLPTGGGASSAQLAFVQQPSQTWYIDQNTQRIQGSVDGLDAVRQAVEIILHVERFRWQIYRPYSGMQWDGLIGQDPGYVASELQRRIKAALLMDDRVRGISSFSYTMTGSTMTADVSVDTVYGEVQTTVEVNTA